MADTRRGRGFWAKQVSRGKARGVEMCPVCEVRSAMPGNVVFIPQRRLELQRVSF